MANREVKSVSFNEDELYLLVFAEENGGFSRVVKDLIREKINEKSQFNTDKLEKIEEILNGIVKKLDENSGIGTKSSVFDEDLLSAMSKFD